MHFLYLFIYRLIYFYTATLSPILLSHSCFVCLSDLGHPLTGVCSRPTDQRGQRLLHRSHQPPHRLWHLRKPHPCKGAAHVHVVTSPAVACLSLPLPEGLTLILAVEAVTFTAQPSAAFASLMSWPWCVCVLLPGVGYRVKGAGADPNRPCGNCLRPSGHLHSGPD